MFVFFACSPAASNGAFATHVPSLLSLRRTINGGSFATICRTKELPTSKKRRSQHALMAGSMNYVELHVAAAAGPALSPPLL